jgi:hypothetical protein
MAEINIFVGGSFALNFKSTTNTTRSFETVVNSLKYAVNSVNSSLSGSGTAAKICNVLVKNYPFEVQPYYSSSHSANFHLYLEYKNYTHVVKVFDANTSKLMYEGSLNNFVPSSLGLDVLAKVGQTVRFRYTNSSGEEWRVVKLSSVTSDKLGGTDLVKNEHRCFSVAYVKELSVVS